MEFYALKHGIIKIATVDKDRPCVIKIKNLYKTGQSVSYRIENHRFRLEFYALKHGTIKNVIVDKDRLSLGEVESLHETGQIMSYRPENHRFRLETLRPETWKH